MPFQNYKWANLAKWRLLAGISASATSIILQTGEGNLFPAVFPYLLKIEKYDATSGLENKPVTKREIVKVMNKAGDTFTIVRGAWDCPVSDTATTQTNTALAFDSGDFAYLVFANEQIEDIQDEVERLETDKANDSVVVKLTGNQTIAGTKTFSSNPQVPTGTTGLDAVNKAQLDADILAAWAVESLNDRDTYLLWEDVVASNSLFVEDWPTFAESTVVQNVGDVAANTRIAIPIFWSWVAGSEFNLALRKFVSPWVDYRFRIETDSAVSPSGTLIDANAEATVTEASLTTSLVDTTVTLAGSITIPLWQRAWIVWFAGTYGSETVNGTNYYGIGYVWRSTTTRNSKKRDGTNRTPFSTIPVTDTDNITFNSTTSTTSAWYRMQAINALSLTTITKSASCNATKVSVKDDGWGTLQTLTFVWNVATLAIPQVFQTGEFFRLECNSSPGLFTSHRLLLATFPQTRTNVAYISGSQGGSSAWADGTTAFNIDSVGTELLINNFIYTSSTLFTPKLLSKTNATYSYKLPNDLPRIATEAKSSWENVVATILGLNDNFSGLTPLATYYISDTPWVIGAVSWTYIYKVWEAVDDVTINISKTAIIRKSTFTTINSSRVSWGWSGTTTSSIYQSDANYRVVFSLNAYAPTSQETYLRIQESDDGSTWRITINRQNAEDSEEMNSSMEVFLLKGKYYRTQIEATSGGGYWSITMLSNILFS